MESAEGLQFEPIVERPLASAPGRIVVSGMGGSYTAALALPYLGIPDIILHESYDLPERAPLDALYLAISYSGNTEETLSFARAALERGCAFAAVASGGALADLAREHRAPLSLVPPGLVPRNALPYLVRAELALLERTDLLEALAGSAPPDAAVAEAASSLAQMLEGAAALFYASGRNALLARIGKMYWNEGAKQPAFVSLIPARNHDELQGFAAARQSPGAFRAILVRDPDDDPRVARRFDVLAGYLPELGVAVHSIELPKAAALFKLLHFWRIVRQAAVNVAARSGADPDDSGITEEFKRRLAAEQ